jgi:hypothetical protein
MNIVQYTDEKSRPRVGGVIDGKVHQLARVTSTIALARLALKDGKSLRVVATALAGKASVPMAALLKEKRVLPPVTHYDPAHCIVTGTGLTHLGSAAARDSMHKKLEGGEAALTDSLKMFKQGLEGGRPAKGQAGVQPEWFYKGDGRWVVSPEKGLPRPSFALDGGEEPELAGIYLIDDRGRPVRLGFALGNEYSDHVTERQNYLLLAHSKLRHSSFGPELVTGKIPASVEGRSRILRKGKMIWEKPFLTGEANMSHTIANLEYHHFKYEAFRQPGDVHVHYFGTATLSFVDGVKAEHGDVFEISAPGFGAPLRNALKVEKPAFRIGGVKSL